MDNLGINNPAYFAHFLGILPSWLLRTVIILSVLTLALCSCPSCLLHTLSVSTHSGAWLRNPCLPLTSLFQLSSPHLQSPPRCLPSNTPWSPQVQHIRTKAYHLSLKATFLFWWFHFSTPFLWKGDFESAYTHQIWSEKQIMVIGFKVLTFLSTTPPHWRT